MILAIIAIGLLTSTLFLLLNRDYLGVAYSNRRNTQMNISSYKAKDKLSNQSPFFKVGHTLAFLFPPKFMEQFERDHVFLGRPKEQIYISLGQSLIVGLGLLLAYLFSKNNALLIFSLIAPILILAETSMAVEKNKKDINKYTPHIVECLKVLVVNTETPVNNALEIIIRGIPDYMSAMKTELLRLLQKAEKTNMKETLMEWKSESGNFKDFLALLVSVNEGASKVAIKGFIEKYLERIREQEQEDIKNEAENLQMYLMGPVMLMFMVVLSPMIFAIQHTMKSAGF